MAKLVAGGSVSVTSSKFGPDCAARHSAYNDYGAETGDLMRRRIKAHAHQGQRVVQWRV
jgi:hypothetical protein